MKHIPQTNSASHFPWYWAVAVFSTFVVFIPLSLATMLWFWLRNTRTATTFFAAMFPVAWLAAIYFVRRRHTKSLVDAAS